MSFLQWPEVSSLPLLSEHQAETLPKALQSRVGILSGTPGTGKTFVASKLIQAVARTHGTRNIAVAAPTGKAAVRLTEMLADSGLSLQAKTIHRLLEVSHAGHGTGDWQFLRCYNNPLEQRFIFIDESSMLDTNLAAALFRAFPPSAHVLLIGDKHQLPPVGHGAPLRDLINSKAVGVAELTEVRRNSGKIVYGCRAIKDGKVFPAPRELDLETGCNWIHLDASNPSRQVSTMLGLLTGTTPNGYDPVFDCQVICSLNEKGNVPRTTLNKELQAALNPLRPEKNHKFALNDKVICTSNGRMEVCEMEMDFARKETVAKRTGIQDFVANGETGRIVSIDNVEKVVAIELICPNRIVCAPLYGEESVSKVFDLGYAITCHKAQGSQMPVVIAMVDDSNGASRVTSREWWYTCLSRAEKILVTVGKWDVLMKQCQPVSLTRRKTFLTEQLEEIAA